MQSKATTVDAYLKELPEDRRAALQAVRDVIRANIDSQFEEGMQYGMIGYYVPHRIHPAGYHCDPKQPLPYAGLASQKQYMSLYLMSIYMGPEADWFAAAWKKTGKKLDMGKSCIRFRKAEDLAMDVIAEAFRRSPAQAYIERYKASLASRSNAKGKDGAKAEPRSGTAAPTAKQATRGRTPVSKSAVKGASVTKKV